MARDGIGRFWSPVDLDKRHMLYMCAVIDPSQSLVTAEPTSEDSNTAHMDHGEDFSPIHYIDCDELHNAIYAQFRHTHNDRLDHRIERVRDMVRDTPDLLFRIQPDGSLTFWGIQHLNTFPRRIPRVFVVLRVAQAIDPVDVVYFLEPVQVLHDYTHIQSSSTIKPVELSVIARNPHGQVRCYGLNLVDFLDTTMFPARLNLKYTWLGHQHAITGIHQSQNSRFCTIGVDGQTNVWKYELRESGGRLTTRLQLDSSIQVKSKTILAIPIDNAKHLAVYDGERVLVYMFDQHDCHLQQYQVCQSSDTMTELSSLYVDSLDDMYLLFGVSASCKRIFTWQLHFQEDGKLESITYHGQQTFAWSVEPRIVFSTDRWSTNTASVLLHKLGMKSIMFGASVGSAVILYHTRADAGKVEWNELYTLDTALEGIVRIRCVTNILAIVSESRQNGPARQLSIWMEMRSGTPPVLYKTFEFSEPIKDIAWNMSSDAQFVLAVAFPNKVAIYGQKRAVNVNDDNASWVCYTEFGVDTPEDIVGIKWVNNGVLVVAAGNQLRCYLKWLTLDDSVLQSRLGVEYMSSIYDLSYGKTDLINCILLSLYRFLKQFIDEENLQIHQVPSLSVSKILELQNNNTKQNVHQQYKALFDDPDDQLDTDNEDDDVRPLSNVESAYLIDYLKSKELPGLSQSERMHLMAVVDTFSEISTQGEALDENGARFTALVENYFHLNSMLDLDKRQLASRDIVWALHSQSQDLLLERCVRLCNGKIMWEDAKALGMFLWLQKIDVVREQMSNIARNTYLAKEEFKDPVGCTLYYLALRKKNLLLSLWRSAHYHKEKQVMVNFLVNDFSQSRWQTAASKNAFVLLGKQRYEYAAAFFLLADKLKDAVGVILKHLKDYQLAIAICRVYEGDQSPLLKDILQTHVLPMAIESNDRWLVNMVFWLLDKPKDAIRATVVPLSQFSTENLVTDSAATVSDPDLFILYQHLKQQIRSQNRQELGIPYDLEYGFSLQVARAYERLGCPLLSLFILARYKMALPVPKAEEKISRASDLFADESPPPLERASDLFAEEYRPSSQAADLFADEDDIFATKQSESTDLFADYKDTSVDLFADTDNDNLPRPESAEDDATLTEVEDQTEQDDGLSAYKALLIIRMLQTVFHAAAMLYDCVPMSDALQSRHRSTFLRNRQDLFTLGENLKIPQQAFSRLLMEKSIEADMFALYLNVLDKGIPDDFNIQGFLEAFKAGCFQVFEAVIIQRDMEYSGLRFVEKWTDHVISTFPIWSSLREQYSSATEFKLATQKIALNAYICLIMVTLRQRHFEKAWSLLSHFKTFMTSLKSNTEIADVFLKLQSNDTRMIEMNQEDFESFSDDSLFGFDLNEEIYKPPLDFQDNSAGANLLEAASLNYVLTVLESCMKSTGKNSTMNSECISHNEKGLLTTEPGEMVTFIWTTLLDPIAHRTHSLKQTIEQVLEKEELTRRNTFKQFKSLRQKKYWHSIKTLTCAEQLLPFVNFSAPEINIMSDDTQLHVHTMYHPPTTAHAFCISSTYVDSMAVCLKSEVHEIDMSKAQKFGLHLVRSGSSVSSGNHDHLDSYPDTEEDDEVSEHSDSELDVAGKHIRRPKHHHQHHQGRTPNPATPILSPARSRLQTEEAQKFSQNLSLDNLQDTLKRSFGIGLSGNQEKMAQNIREHQQGQVLQKTTKEWWDITGCESHNGGPSVMLWQFGQEREIASYYGCHDKPTRIHFDQFGQKFGAGDTSGALNLWRFDSHAHSNKPYYIFDTNRLLGH
ncbi:regulator of (H+)-ATPase in vacuolar membrane [Apophysomyces sp. BC1021]|nr:regulator of (H+)-ATPase in vacuolar membrane [Apophysomyces sp. BC1021]